MAKELDLREAFTQTRQFYLIYLMDFMSIFPIYYLAQVFKVYGMELGGFDDLMLTTVGSFGSLANGFSRVILGSMQDKSGFSSIYRTICALELFVCIFTPTIVTTNKWAYLVIIFVTFGCLGAHFVIFPNVMLKIYGLKAGVTLSSITYATRACSTLSAAFLSKWLSRAYGAHAHSYLLYMSVILLIGALVIKEFLFSEEPILKEDKSMPLLSGTAAYTAAERREYMQQIETKDVCESKYEGNILERNQKICMKTETN